MKSGFRELLRAAESEITAIDVGAAIELMGDPDAVIVDIRDIRELQREGRIPGSVHAPRGMLEFWVDPDSPYHREIFASGKRFVFHCSKGWRSALATKTMQDMGLARVAHIAGGFEAWVAAGGPVEAKDN
jgi:rhodanese-related sulfurtransferase